MGQQCFYKQPHIISLSSYTDQLSPSQNGEFWPYYFIVGPPLNFSALTLKHHCLLNSSLNLFTASVYLLPAFGVRTFFSFFWSSGLSRVGNVCELSIAYFSTRFVNLRPVYWHITHGLIVTATFIQYSVFEKPSSGCKRETTHLPCFLQLATLTKDVLISFTEVWDSVLALNHWF